MRDVRPQPGVPRSSSSGKFDVRLAREMQNPYPRVCQDSETSDTIYEEDRRTMTQLDISVEEATTLKTTLESVVSDLRYEINDTDAHDFREELKRKQKILERILGQLGAG